MPELGQDLAPSQLRWRDLTGEATAAVSQRPGRTLLTALGTILGVGAFVVTSGLAQTAEAQVSARFDALAATEVRIEDAQPDGTDPFPVDPDATLEVLNGVNHAGLSFAVPGADRGVVRKTASLSSGIALREIPVIAATPGAIAASLPVLSAGRSYDRWHEERGERVVVLGRVAANDLGISSVDNQPAVFLNDSAYTVVGILNHVERNQDYLLAAIISNVA